MGERDWTTKSNRKNENKQRAPFKSNPQTHHSGWHDDTSMWPEYPYRALPHNSQMHHSHPHTANQHPSRSDQHCYLNHLYRKSITVYSYSFRATNSTYCKDFLQRLLCKCAAPNFTDVFTAKVGVRVWPFASYNIDRAMICGPNSAPLAVRLAHGQGVMSMWGAYRPIKAAVPIPVGRPHRQDTETDERREANQGWKIFFSYWGYKSVQNKGRAYTLEL